MGLGLIAYPGFADWWNSFHQSRAVASYAESVANLDASKYSEMLAESEEKSANLQMELLNPELSSNYERLMEIQASIDEEARKQESLLERILETELELEEMSRE